jgi:hypothetical protein
MVEQKTLQHGNLLQFGLKTLLFVTTLIAVVLGWQLRPTPGEVTMRQFKHLQPGMTRAEVRSCLGPLKYPEHEPMHLWVYKVVDRNAEDDRLRIHFDDAGQVAHFYYWR